MKKIIESHCEAAYQAKPKQSQIRDCFVAPLGLLAMTALITLLSFKGHHAFAEGISQIEIVFDASNSMNAQSAGAPGSDRAGDSPVLAPIRRKGGGVTKMQIAKQALTTLAGQGQVFEGEGRGHLRHVLLQFPRASGLR